MKLSPAEYQTLLRKDFVTFIERSFYEINPQTELKMGLYIELIASMLEDCRTGKIKRLIISIPPRYLKSHCASIAFVAWLLGHNPATQAICVSYGQALAEKMARDCRTVMNSSWYKKTFRTRLSLEKQAVNDFFTTDMGLRMATSVGGVLTGRGADFIIIDDPMKPEDALSETQRTNVNEWFDGTLLSRLNDKANGCIIIIMQRLHQDDLVGHVLEKHGKWEVLNLPAIAEANETFVINGALSQKLFTRREGDALHAERESLDMLASFRQRMGDYNFSSQYQQNPIPLGGAMMKNQWIMYYDETMHHTEFGEIVQSWDTANKSGELNDYSVCTTWGRKNKRYYLLHVFRKRLNYPELKRAVKELFDQHKPGKVLIEDKASGTQLIQDLQSEGMFQVKAFEPPKGTDKIMRLHAVTALFENSLVYLPRQASWLADYLHELTSFPGSKFDDQVDSTTQALEHLKSDNTLEIWEKLFDDTPTTGSSHPSGWF